MIWLEFVAFHSSLFEERSDFRKLFHRLDVLNTFGLLLYLTLCFRRPLQHDIQFITKRLLRKIIRFTTKIFRKRPILTSIRYYAHAGKCFNRNILIFHIPGISHILILCEKEKLFHSVEMQRLYNACYRSRIRALRIDYFNLLLPFSMHSASQQNS